MGPSLYTPNNVSVYAAAFSGAYAGIAATGRTPYNPSSAIDVQAALVACKYAEEVDTAFGAATPSTLAVNQIQALSQGFFTGCGTLGVNATALTELATSLLTLLTDAQGTLDTNFGVTLPSSTTSGGTLQTTDNSPTFIPGTIVAMGPNQALAHEIDVIARSNDGSESAEWKHQDLWVRLGTAAPSNVGPLFSLAIGSNGGAPPAGWDAVNASTGNSVGVQITGPNGETIHWSAIIRPQLI